MGVKCWILFVILLVFISGCYTDKTRPIVTDVVEVVPEEETAEEEVIEQEDVIEGNETTDEEEIALEVNETKEIELPPGAHIVTIKDLKLDPQELTIQQGDTIVWNHEDEWEEEGVTKHYIAAHNNEFRSSIFYYGETFNHTFDEAGNFTYFDVLYPKKDGLRGEIVVE